MASIYSCGVLASIVILWAMPAAAVSAPAGVPVNGGITDQGASWPTKLQRGKAAGAPSADPFSSKSWIPPPKAEVPPPPSVPAFPYTLVGKVVGDGGRPTLFLSRSGQMFTAQAGDILEGTFRVDGIGESGIELTYLPLAKRLALSYAEMAPKMLALSYPTARSTVSSYAPVAGSVATMQSGAVPEMTEGSGASGDRGSSSIAQNASGVAGSVANGASGQAVGVGIPAQGSSGSSQSTGVTDAVPPGQAVGNGTPGQGSSGSSQSTGVTGSGTMEILPPSGTMPMAPAKGTMPIAPAKGTMPMAPPSGTMPIMPAPTSAAPTQPLAMSLR